MSGTETTRPRTVGGGPDSTDPVRRWYGPVLLIGLLCAVGLVVGAARPWAEATVDVAGLPRIQASVAGSDIAPIVGALGVVVLAAFGAVIATRGWVRRGLGVAVVVASLVVLVEAIHPGGAGSELRAGLQAKGWTGGGFAESAGVWRWLVLAAAIGCVATGAATALLGHRWAVMGSRYDSPAGRAAAGVGRRRTDSTAPAPEDMREGEVWQAIDRGDDPTADR